MSRPLVRCSEQCGQQTAEEVELCGKYMTILCDMLAAWKLLEVLSSMDTTLFDEEVWTELVAIPLRAKMSSKTMDVLVAIHVEGQQFLQGSIGSPHKRTQAHAEVCGEFG